MNWGILGAGAIATQFAEGLARVPGAPVALGRGRGDRLRSRGRGWPPRRAERELDAYGQNEVALSGAAGRCVFLEPITNPPDYWQRAPLGRGLMRGARWPAGGLEHEIAEVER